MSKFLQTIAWMLLLCRIGHAAEHPSVHWPRWRGPAADGSARGGSYPVEWTADDNLEWKVKLPGRGCSTPIVWGEHIVVTAPIDGNDGIVCLDWSGATRWRTSLGAERKGRHRSGSGANSSPVTDGKLIFAYFKSGRLAGLDFRGELLWQTNLQDRFGKDTLYWDVGTSPVATDKHVVAAVMHEGGSYLAAFDKPTGKLAWKVDRNYDCPVEGDHSYATPTVINHEGRQAIVVWGAEHVTAHSAADGKLLWSCGGFNPQRKANWVSVSSSVVTGDMVVVPHGRGSLMTAVRLGGQGDVTQTHRRWTNELDERSVAFVPTPAAHDGKIYVLGDRGRITCIDAESGQTLWADALPQHRMKYYASPTIAEGKLYAAREDGVVFVVRVTGGFKVLSENAMGEQTIATPVPAANRLFVRGARHLFCIKAP